MKNFRLKMLIGAVVCAFITAGAGITVAQPKEKGKGSYSKEYKGNGDMTARWSEKMQTRMTDLRGKLNLSASQEKAWNDYSEVITSSIKVPKMRDKAELATMTAPERLEKMHAKVKEHEAVMARLLEATKTFYAQLTPEQQKIFDAETLMARGKKPGRDRSRR